MDFSDEKFKDEEQISYCIHCLEYGFSEKLGPRIYPANEPIPADKDQWQMCFECGSIFGIHETYSESKINNAIETISSPFESGSEFLAVDSKKLRNKKRKDKELDWIGVRLTKIKGQWKCSKCGYIFRKELIIV